ncbi:MAG TPA: hypothetical protein PKD12_06405 [Nitrospira sp.]|nr:hypothetical protein [Nitrospira sp.]
MYWVALALVLAAWFADSPVKVTPSDSQSKPKLEVTKAVEDPTPFGVSGDQWSPGGKCNIEYINGTPLTAAAYSLSKKSTVLLVGWALDLEQRRLPDSVIMRFAGKDDTNYFALSRTGLARSDVRDYFGAPEALVASGFEANVNLNDLPAGDYVLSLIMKFVDAAFVCDNDRRILVR